MLGRALRCLFRLWWSRTGPRSSQPTATPRRGLGLTQRGGSFVLVGFGAVLGLPTILRAQLHRPEHGFSHTGELCHEAGPFSRRYGTWFACARRPGGWRRRGWGLFSRFQATSCLLRASGWPQWGLNPFFNGFGLGRNCFWDFRCPNRTRSSTLNVQRSFTWLVCIWSHCLCSFLFHWNLSHLFAIFQPFRTIGLKAMGFEFLCSRALDNWRSFWDLGTGSHCIKWFALSRIPGCLLPCRDNLRRLRFGGYFLLLRWLTRLGWFRIQGGCYWLGFRCSP